MTKKKGLSPLVWPERWPVIGTSGKEYTVGKKRDGTWGCSCESWIFQKKDKWIYDPVIHNVRRRDCQHIMQKKMELMQKNGVSQNATNEIKVEEYSDTRDITLEE